MHHRVDQRHRVSAAGGVERGGEQHRARPRAAARGCGQGIDARCNAVGIGHVLGADSARRAHARPAVAHRGVARGRIDHARPHRLACRARNFARVLVVVAVGRIARRIARRQPVIVDLRSDVVGSRAGIAAQGDGHCRGIAVAIAVGDLILKGYRARFTTTRSVSESAVVVVDQSASAAQRAGNECDSRDQRAIRAAGIVAEYVDGDRGVFR